VRIFTEEKLKEVSEFLEKKYANFDVLGILSAGDSFGEIALMTE
jgi:CRP-like cAMP-binding protein